jgi:Flp pilus assembly pilin Flp
MLDRISFGLGRLLTFRIADLRREDGQGVTEYGIVLAFVAIALAAVLGILHTQIATFIDTVGDDLGNLPGSF